MGKSNEKTFKVNVSGMTEKAYNFVNDRAKRMGLNRAGVIKMIVDEKMEAEASE